MSDWMTSFSSARSRKPLLPELEKASMEEESSRLATDDLFWHEFFP